MPSKSHRHAVGNKSDVFDSCETPFVPQVMEHVAAVLGMDSAAVKAANFLSDLTSSSSSNHCSKAAIGSSCAISSNMGRLCIGSPAAYLQQHKQHTPGNAALLNKLGAEQLTQQHKLQHQAGVTTVLGRFISSDTYTLPLLWQQLLSSSQYSARLSAVQQYNRDHAWSKRGIVVTPVRCVVSWWLALLCLQPTEPR